MYYTSSCVDVWLIDIIHRMRCVMRYILYTANIVCIIMHQQVSVPIAELMLHCLPPIANDWRFARAATSQRPRCSFEYDLRKCPCDTVCEWFPQMILWFGILQYSPCVELGFRFSFAVDHALLHCNYKFNSLILLFVCWRHSRWVFFLNMISPVRQNIPILCANWQRMT